MSKLFASYSNSFAEKRLGINALYDHIIGIDSLNGFYIAIDESLELSRIGSKNNTPSNISTWYDLSGSTNYLYTIDNEAPIFIPRDTLLNENSSIDFGATGTKQLLFKNPYHIKTVIVVYYLKAHSSYLFYAPLQTPPPDPVYYDALPSFTDKLWTRCSLSNDLAFNATSRINLNNVVPTSYLPLNSPRILTVTNFGGNGSAVQLHGIGGRNGVPNGGEYAGDKVDGVKGSIAAILTFDDVLATDELEVIENYLRDIYINYQGPTLSTLPKLKYLLNGNINYDFSTITIDEWADILQYEILYPANIIFSFNGSVLQGTASELYADNIIIRITNSLGLQTIHTIPLEIVKADPLIDLLPRQESMVLVLSSAYDAVENAAYGVYTDSIDNVVQWEDARRVGDIVTAFSTKNEPLAKYVRGDVNYVSFNSNAANVASNEYYGFNRTVNAKSILFVYRQKAYGKRPLFDGLYDIRGNGVLFTTASNTQIHGQTDNTRWTTRISKVVGDTLTERLDLNELVFVTMVQQDDDSIPLYGLESLRGELYFICIWDSVLSPHLLDLAIAGIADRYYNSEKPFIVDNKREIRYDSNITVDLRNKVVDLKNRPLTYSIVGNHYGAVINNHILSFTAQLDELLEFSIEVNNGVDTILLTFEIDITIRTDSFYVTLKNYLNTLPSQPDISNIFIAESDSLVKDISNNLTLWRDYRLTGNQLGNQGASIISSTLLNNKLGVSFQSDGSDFLEVINNGTISSSDWFVVYIRPPGITGNVSIFGNNTVPTFGGTVSELFSTNMASSPVLFGSKYVNKGIVSNNYSFSSNVINTLYIHTTTSVSINTIGKDRLFTDSSVKGLIPLFFTLNKQVSFAEYTVLDSLVRDYYDPIRFVILLHLNNSLVDSSVEAKTLTGPSSFAPVSKFGSHSLNLATSSLSIPNNSDLAYLNESFTISLWFILTNALGSNVTAYIYRQPDLSIYIKGDSLYIDDDDFNSNFLISYQLPQSIYAAQVTSMSYHHMELSRKSNSNLLQLYIDGIKVAEVPHFKEYRNSLDNGRIGGSLQSNIGAILYIDEFAIFKRGYIHDSNFTPATSEFNI